MPRGKFINHKGKRRQFTPVEVLQREDEREGCKAGKSFDNHLNGKCKKVGGAVAGLIEISNPNRPIKKMVRLASSSDLSGAETPNGERRQERSKEKLRQFITQKTPSEINADLARLALVRKKREAAAEQRRLAFAKKEAPELQTSKSELFIDKGCNKIKPNTETSDKKYNSNENLGKHIKGRSGTKRNVNMHV